MWGLDVNATGRVYLAGTFATVNAIATPGGFVALQTSNGQNLPGMATFQPNTTTVSRQTAYDVLEVAGKVYVAGSQHYLQVLNAADLSLQVFHRSSPRGDFQTIASLGGRVYGGSHSYNGTTLSSATSVQWVGTPPPGVTNPTPFATSPHTWVSAFNPTNGFHLPSFLPNNMVTTGAGVWAIADGGSGCLWLGGAITKVGAVDQFGITRLCEPVADTVRPSNPSGLSGTVTGTSVALTWNLATDNVGVTGYRIYDATNTVVATTTAPPTTLINLSPGTYSYSARAYDAAGNLSYKSNTVTVTVL